MPRTVVQMSNACSVEESTRMHTSLLPIFIALSTLIFLCFTSLYLSCGFVCSGFSIEIGSALTVLAASMIGIPISSTHCKVGSVVIVGRVRSKGNVDWKIFGGIIIAWVVTLPAAGLISAAVFYGLQYLVPPLGPPWATDANIASSLNITTTTNATTFY